ncbi:fimbrial protein [Citrobacter braakii]|uniref:fimbrial protein n=1 Tax=Citrobacter braakii TaxID=57706 RepID=UPI00103F078A|nr:fimbrial protein [Citrobacter braakii]TCC82129.1 hypothetical protein EY916_23830 [Citrobacter braakii]HAT7506638.1 fimbrial protein [Citrobacter braakii]
MINSVFKNAVFFFTTKMKLNTFLLSLFFICVGSANAGDREWRVVLGRSGNTTSIATFTFSQDVTNNGGEVALGKRLSTYPSELKFRVDPNTLTPGLSRWTSSSPVIEGGYDSSNVDTSDAVGYNGRKYYRLKNIAGKNFPVYIRLEQEVWLPKGGYNAWVDLPDLHNVTTSGDSLGWYEFNTVWNRNGLSRCSEGDGNYNSNVECSSSNLIFTLDSQYNSRSVNVYFYMPRTPISTITIPSMKVGQSSIHHMCIDRGDDDGDYENAIECTKAAATTPLTDFYLQGTLTFKTTCSMETAKTIDLAATSVGKLVGKGQGGIPDGYTPTETKVALNCTGDINSSFTKGVVWSITGVGGSLSAGAQQGILLAQGTGISDLGVKITSDAAGKNPVKVDGTQTVQAEASGKTATAKFYAYPTPASASKAPTGAGNYQAMATLTFDMP